MTVLVYGAYGYTGGLIARAALDRGLDPILAGRDGDRLRELGRELRADVREFDLSIPEVVAESVRDVDVVCNCAGPFAATAEPLVDACIDTGTDYLDVTGEYRVLEAIAARDEEAAAAGVTLLPAVGFDVAATDCLAAALVGRLPDTTELLLGFDADGAVSRGTARTAVRGLGEGPVIRRDGELVRAGDGFERERRFDFGRGERPALAVAWGDVVTAAHTTGVGDVAVFAALDLRVMRAIRLSRPLGPLLRTRPVRWLLDRLVAGHVEGPTADERAANEVYLRGEARSPDGDGVVERLRTPDPYDVTVETTLAAIERVERDEPDARGEGGETSRHGDGVPNGFTTPAGAFGPSFIDGVDGVRWMDR